MKSYKWNCKIKLQDNCLLDEDFKSLKDISTRLGVSYARISELAPKGRHNKKRHNSPYFTDIYITSKEEEQEKKEEIAPSISNNN